MTAPSTAGIREAIRFANGGEVCAAWHYAGTNGGCVIMAGGFAVPKEPATDLFARRFWEAGFTVLAFDYRRLGASGGRPRQVVRVSEQLADWRAAIEAARRLPEVDPARIALWGFSLSGGHVLAVAREADVAAAIAQTPNAGGPAASRNVMRHHTPQALLRLTLRGIRDIGRGLIGRDPLMVPLAGRPGDVAVLTTPDAMDAARALDPHARYPEWRREVAARSALTVGPYRPGRHASRVSCPLLVVVCEDDTSALPAAAVRVARRAPRGELVHLPGNHYAPFLESHDAAVDAELEFLARHLGTEGRQPRHGRATSI